MIKLENVVLASPEQMEFIIEGMRNPMNSWEKSDSVKCYTNEKCQCICNENIIGLCVGNNDRLLMQRLAKAGTDHRKFMRMMPVYMRITAPLYWWKEFDTYKVGTVANSCSTMHKIQENILTLDDFSCEHLSQHSIELLDAQINEINKAILYFREHEDKDDWWQIIQLLPSSYNQTRNVMLNYEVLANIYKSRKNHKLDEWREFCEWIEELPYSELICKNEPIFMTPNEQREKMELDPVKEPSESLKMVEVSKAAVVGIQDGLKNSDSELAKKVDGGIPMTPDEINTIVDIEKAMSSDSGRGAGLWQPGDKF